jgi:autophagy-related protein 5
MRCRSFEWSWGDGEHGLMNVWIGQPQTIGTALNQILPSLFPSRRSPLLAQPVLHGAVLPLNAGVEELVRAAAYLDGWLHIAVVMMG